MGHPVRLMNSPMVTKFTHLLATLRAFGILTTSEMWPQQQQPLKALPPPRSLRVVITKAPLTLTLHLSRSEGLEIQFPLPSPSLILCHGSVGIE